MTPNNNSQLDSVIEVIQDLSEDSGLPKNIKNKLVEAVIILKNGEEETTKVNKALELLDEINEESNLPQYTRTQLWNIVSILSTIN